MMEQKKARKGAPMGVLDVLRIVRSIGRRVDDPEGLGQLMQIQAAVELEVARVAHRLYEEGFSYTDLARAAGTTRQTASQRWPAAWRRHGLPPVRQDRAA
jgi:Homeodomain-like domain